MIRVLEEAIAQVEAGGPGAKNGRNVIHEIWRMRTTTDPLEMMVLALKDTEQFQRPKWREWILARGSEQQLREWLIEIALRHFEGLPPERPDPQTLWDAIVKWLDRGSHARWPAIYALARSIGVNQSDATIQRQVKRIEERLAK
jgi:hypothetical protein